MSEDDSESPSDVRAVIIDELFLNYDILFDDQESTVYADCNHCDEIVSTMEYSDVCDMGEMELYEQIIEDHRNL